MKRLLFLLSLPLLLVSCENIDSDEFVTIFVHSFVSVYYDGSFVIKERDVDSNSIYMGLSRYRETIRYCAPEFRKSNTNNEFLKIAERNGDRSYNETVSFLKGSYPGPACLANNYKAVRIVCTNKAWDAQHPAGSLLNDIVQIGYDTYAPFIKKGYAGEYYERVKKPLTTLTENDLSMISGVYFYFDNSPARGSYQLKVTLVTTEGVEQGTTFLWEQ